MGPIECNETAQAAKVAQERRPAIALDDGRSEVPMLDDEFGEIWREGVGPGEAFVESVAERGD